LVDVISPRELRDGRSCPVDWPVGRRPQRRPCGMILKALRHESLGSPKTPSGSGQSIEGSR